MYVRMRPFPSLPVKELSSASNLSTISLLRSIRCNQEGSADLLKTSALYSAERERRVEPWIRRRFVRIGRRSKLETSEPKAVFDHRDQLIHRSAVQQYAVR